VKFDDDMLPSLRAVGEQLHEAARRETAPARRRRRRRRALVATVAILLLAAAVATAARLIAVGGPVEDRHGQPAGLMPRAPGDRRRGARPGRRAAVGGARVHQPRRPRLTCA
jgi:hypothetical protein